MSASGWTEETFQKQIQFALMLQNMQNCARSKEAILKSDCLCHGNPEFENCAEKATEFLNSISATKKSK